ncbi:hypothetical protein SNE40_003512 [Patella caerulea]|uniref:BTB domain-containing protein n=1 Tax=Patella caerulea TaxID=87958 RepID=A0AAN8KE46_PATCE
MELIQLNIGGKIFVTTRSTLSRIPNTKLSDLKENSIHYRSACKEFFFDRDPEAFACILNYYRTSELHLSHKLCGNAIRKELEFWGMDISIVSSCCWKRLFEVDEDEQVLNNLKKGIADESGLLDNNNSSKSKRHLLKHRIWLLLDKPNSSTAAKVSS